jgi:sec-independent protein translocase protein TatC
VEPDEVRMTLVEHLDELRQRLLRSLLALGVALAATVCFYKPLVEVMTIPHFRAMSWLEPPPPNATFIAVDYGGPVFAIMKLCFIVALFLASPVIGRELWGFVAAGLHRHERRAAAETRDRGAPALQKI